MISDSDAFITLPEAEKRGYLNAEETKAAKEAAANHLTLERKQDLAVLQLMIDTPLEDRVAKAAEIELPWEEYLRLLSKYKVVLMRYEKDKEDKSDE